MDHNPHDRLRLLGATSAPLHAAARGRRPAVGETGNRLLRRRRNNSRLPTAVGVLLAVALAASIPAREASADPAALADSARCSMCHNAEAQRVGPSWAAIAERYAGEDGALAMLTTRTRAGGSGEWGKAPMPPVSQAQLSDADLEAVLTWILDR